MEVDRRLIAEMEKDDRERHREHECLWGDRTARKGAETRRARPQGECLGGHGAAESSPGATVESLPDALSAFLAPLGCRRRDVRLSSPWLRRDGRRTPRLLDGDLRPLRARACCDRLRPEPAR